MTMPYNAFLVYCFKTLFSFCEFTLLIHKNNLFRKWLWTCQCQENLYSLFTVGSAAVHCGCVNQTLRVLCLTLRNTEVWGVRESNQ